MDRSLLPSVCYPGPSGSIRGSTAVFRFIGRVLARARLTGRAATRKHQGVPESPGSQLFDSIFLTFPGRFRSGVGRKMGS